MTASQPGTALVEGIARVVRVADGVALLEPEQTTSCGSCAASAACGQKGIGTLASRVEARRFALQNGVETPPLQEGERVVLGVGQRALIKAALLAYGLPLLAALGAGGLAYRLYGSDAAALLGMGGGLAIGLVAARLGARRLAARGELSPRFLRRALPGETCGKP